METAMGKIIRYNCKCGYTQDLFEGYGMLSINLPAIGKFFPEETENFQTLKKSGRINHFGMMNKPCVCPSCKTLQTMPVFSYETVDGEKRDFAKTPCPACGTSMLPLKDDMVSEAENDNVSPSPGVVSCPKCQSPMQHNTVGHWD